MTDQNAVIWSVSKDSYQPSYLMGTMHVRDVRAFQKYDKAIQIIERCTFFYAEMDLTQAEELQQPKDFFIPDGLNLEDLLGSRKYQKIKRSLDRSFHFNLDLHKHLLPFLISNLIAETILQNDHQQGLDHILYQYAADQNLILGGLESFHEQRSIMNKIPLDFQLKSLKDVARNPAKFKKNLLTLVDHYLKEDIHMLYKLSKKSMGKLRKLMLWERNQLMANRIIDFMAQGQCFFAIGAGHLGGQKGVINILKRHGLMLNPLH